MFFITRFHQTKLIDDSVNHLGESFRFFDQKGEEGEKKKGGGEKRKKERK